MNDQIDYDLVRQRVKRGIEKQKQLMHTFLFALNVLMFVLFMVIAYGIYLSGDGNSLSDIFASSELEATNPALSALVVLTAGWLTSLILHGVSLFMNTKLGERQIRNRVIANELGRELFQLDAEEDPLPKRKRLMELVDDGELAEIDDFDDVELASAVDQHMSSSRSS